MVDLILSRAHKFALWRAALHWMALAGAALCATGAFAQAMTASQALVEINSGLTTFKNMVNSHTAAGDLDYTHFAPYFDANYRNDGQGRNAVTAEFAEGLRGASISSITVNSILSIHTDGSGNSMASTTGTVAATTPHGSFSQTWSESNPEMNDLAWFYKPAGATTWKLYGNQLLARLQVQTFTERRQGGFTCQSGCDGVYFFTWFQAQAPQGNFSSVSVNGPGVNAAPLVIFGSNSKQTQASPLPAPKLIFNSDQFVLNGRAVSSLPAPGTQYTFTLTPPSGAPLQVIRAVAKTTTEPITITSPTGHALADAHLGGSLTINWTLPTTFTVQSVDVRMATNSAAGMCDALSSDYLAPSATSYTFSGVPTQCLGQPIMDGVSPALPVQITVEVRGVNGEVTRAWYSFGTNSTNSCGSNTPPASLAAASVSGSQVQLQWQKACMPSAISNYGIYRSTSAAGTFTLIGTTDLNTLSYYDNSVSSGATYYYYVVATDTAANVSAQSNHVGPITASSGGVTTTTTTTTTTPTTTTTSTGSTTTTTASTTTTTASTTTTTLAGSGSTANVVGGWNLLGNGLSNAITVSSLFGEQSLVSTVWKWIAASNAWAFYTPTLGDGGAAYAASKGYAFLTTINAGEGFWVNAKSGFSAQLSGSAVSASSFADGLTSNALPAGWSLIAIGDNKTPVAFANSIAQNPPVAGATAATSLTTLWAWDAMLAGWYFFAPSLVNAGTQASYNATKSYLDFGTRTLTPTTGFWVNHP